jgi:hypothetical protein
MPGHGQRSQLIGILILGLILGGCSKAEPSDTSRLPASADPGYNKSLDDPAHVGNLADDADPSSTLKFPKPYGLDPIIRSETHWSRPQRGPDSPPGRPRTRRPAP